MCMKPVLFSSGSGMTATMVVRSISLIAFEKEAPAYSQWHL
jgi:hypothetical protein